MARIVDPQNRESEILHRFVDFQGKDVLDVGCGEGRTALRIARFANSVLGIDPEAESIEVARTAAGDSSNVEFRVADAVEEEFPDSSFDVVLFTRSMC